MEKDKLGEEESVCEEEIITEENSFQEASCMPQTAVYDSKNRFFFIDNIRGFLVLLLSFAVVMYRFHFIPYFFGHVSAATNGLGFADIGMPAFIFLLSMMMSYNFKRNIVQKGVKVVVKASIVRGTALIGVGFIMNYFADGLGLTGWSVLATYGLASMFMLAFMPIKKAEIRFGIGFGIMLLYHVVLTAIYPAMSSFVPGTSDGGIVGTVAYLGLMLVSSAIGELYFSNKKRFYLLSIITGGLAILFIILRFAVPADSNFMPYIFINKHHQSISFMTISLAIVVGVFMLADKWKYLHKKHLPIFGAMGQNALIFYVVGEYSANLHGLFSD
ncbi:MAG: hypothetical protein FWE22_06905 [Firmicutes bacterium]|nr:hypothetical protein [Bacillota bacterium]